MRLMDCARQHVRLSLFVLFQACLVTVASADPIRVYAAGSLNGPLKEIVAASGIEATLTFGPAGVLEERLEKGEQADLFLSADLAKPQKLIEAKRATSVIPFARNNLCTLSKPGLGLTDANLLDKFLDPATRLATSTPVADPGGDYAWAIFARADAVHPGARKALEDKALKLMGSPNAMVPIAGKTPAASIFLADKADALIYYCSGQADTLRDVPGLVSRRLPPNIDVTAVYGLSLLSEKPEAERLALFVLSDRGQAILAKSGLLPVLAQDPAPAQAAPATAPEEGLALQNGGNAPVVLTPERIAALPQVTVQVKQKTGKGEETTQWSGPLLWDVLTSAGVLDAARHGEHPKLTIHASGSDGYTVTIAVAEISPEFEAKQVLVADHLGGAALSGGALRLIVPGDRRAGRSVRDLVRITID